MANLFDGHRVIDRCVAARLRGERHEWLRDLVQLLAGEDSNHTRVPGGLTDVDAGDGGVGVGAADKDSVEYAVGHHIGHKLALADQEAFVLDPLDGLTDEAESAGLR